MTKDLKEDAIKIKGKTNNNHRKQWSTRVRTGTILSNGYRHGARYGVREYFHRTAAVAHIGRKLLANEQVHHIDGNKLNNNPDNLMVLDRSDHARLHAIKRGFGKNRIGISPVNKYSEKVINLLIDIRLRGHTIKNCAYLVGMSYPTAQKYIKENIYD